MVFELKCFQLLFVNFNRSKNKFHDQFEKIACLLPGLNELFMSSRRLHTVCLGLFKELLFVFEV